MSDFRPLVSIIIPVYNGENYLKQSIESAIRQTYDNIEIIVVNDGSNDDGKTEQIAKSYDKVRYFYKKNGGVSSALNLGIRVMRGDFFSWLSHDDLYDEDKIEKQIELIHKNYNKRIIALCNTQQIDKNSNNIFNVEKFRFKDEEIIDSEKMLDFLLSGYSINGCALLIPKTAFETCGLFDEELRFCQDGLMWLQFCFNNFLFVYDSKKMVYNRIHDKQVTHNKRDLYYSDSKKIYCKIINKIIDKSNQKRNFYYKYAKNRALTGHSDIVKDILKSNKKNKKISTIQTLYIRLFSIYGYLRPCVRKIYYKIFKGVKIN